MYRRRLFVLAVCAAIGSTRRVRASEITWVNSAGGAFENGANWSPAAEPGATDTTIFNLAAVNPYTVNFTAGAQILRLITGSDRITFTAASPSPTPPVLRISGESSYPSVLLAQLPGESTDLNLNGMTLESHFNSSIAAGGGTSAHVSLSNGARWNSDALFVGDSGIGTLDVTGGSVVSVRNSAGVGSLSGSAGTLNVSGAGSRFETPLHLVLDGNTRTPNPDEPFRGGRGTLNVTNGATVSIEELHIGLGIDGVGTATVSGVSGTSRATVAAHSVSVGEYGRGSLAVSNGALVSAAGMTIGYNRGSDGQVTVGGASGGSPAELRFTGRLGLGNGTVGRPGPDYAGRLTVDPGGTVSSMQTVLGDGMGGSGTVTVEGGDFSCTDRLGIANGSITLSAGTFLAPIERIGADGAPPTIAAIFTQTGGVHAAPPATPGGALRPVNMTLPAASSTYRLAGGTLIASVFNIGSFEYSSGQFIGDFLNFDGGTTTILPDPDPSGPRTITGSVTNTSVFRIDRATLSVGGSYTNEAKGTLVAGPGAALELGGGFASRSTQAATWDTSAAELRFVQPPAGSADHSLLVTGADLGADPAGYVNNFAWGALSLAAGQGLLLTDGNATPGGALYVHTLGLSDGIAQISRVAGNGLNIYYDPSVAANAYLGRQTYALEGGGAIAPVPEASFVAFAPIAAVGLLRRRRRL